MRHRVREGTIEEPIQCSLQALHPGRATRSFFQVKASDVERSGGRVPPVEVRDSDGRRGYMIGGDETASLPP